MSKKLVILAGLGLAMFFAALRPPLSACAMCGCRRRRRKAEEKAYAEYHAQGHKGHAHGHKGHAKSHAGHAHKKDVRLDPAIPVVSTAGLVAMRNARVPMYVVDARAGKYDDGVRIPGAINLHTKSPLRLIRRKLRNKRRLVVTYCASLKCPASANFAALLGKLGYKNVLEFPYGIKGWREGGHATTAAK